MIVHKSFAHGWFYHYRYHAPKTQSLCNPSLKPLQKYLIDVRDNCPDEYFLKGPRGSHLKFDVGAELEKLKGHEVCDLAKQGLEEGKYKTAHSNVQMFMLQNDDKTISVETPLWMTCDEFSRFGEIFSCSDPLTGHIDALRVEDGNIWVWDYKPKAHLEKFASTQVYFYCLMLSRRTGIPIERFRAGYFDEKLAFVFRPDRIG